MNILDIFILAVLIFGVLAGMYKGFIASVLNTLGLIASWVGAKALYAKVAHLALSNTTLMAALSQYLEPSSFFASEAQAATSVTEVISGGESAIQSAIGTVSSKLEIIAKAFEENIRNQAFSKLNLSSLSEYLDQTVWQAVFNVAAFVLCFFVLYLLASMVVNLLDHVIRFPVLRICDKLVGALFGLVRSSIIVVLLLSIVPAVISLLSPELTETLVGESKLYGTIMNLDFLSVQNMLRQLVAGKV